MYNSVEKFEKVIKAGFSNFYSMAYRKAYRGSWYKKLPRTYQLQVGRAIFMLRDATVNPWKYVAQNSDTLDAAFFADAQMRTRLNNFLEEVKDWYANVSPQNAKRIVAMYKKSRDDFIIERDGYAVLYINKFFDNPTLRRIFLGEGRGTR